MIRRLLAGIFIAGLSTTAYAQDSSLRVCFGEYDAPRADKKTGKGFDVDVMQLVAQRLGRQLQPVWVEQEERMTDAEHSDLPIAELSSGVCDAVASIPGADALRGAKAPLALSEPYYGAGFEFVATEQGPADLSQMKSKRLIIQFMTVGHLVAEAAGMTWTGVNSPEEQLKELQAGNGDAALIWGPALAPLKAAPKAGTNPADVLRWNLHVATREADGALGAGVNKALSEMLASGEIAKLLEAHGIPPHGPFDSVFNQMALINLQLHR